MKPLRRDEKDVKSVQINRIAQFDCALVQYLGSRHNLLP